MVEGRDSHGTAHSALKTLRAVRDKRPQHVCGQRCKSSGQYPQIQPNPFKTEPSIGSVSNGRVNGLVMPKSGAAWPRAGSLQLVNYIFLYFRSS